MKSMNLCWIFFVNGSSVSHLNITWVALIPKSGSPTSIEDYRPISMVGALYKIISKILSHRLKDVIDYLIDESQSAFVGNRQILDGVLIANESIRWLKKKRKYRARSSNLISKRRTIPSIGHS